MTGSVMKYFDVLEATWPPVSRTQVNGWTLRDGAGGGKRVSAATLARPEADPSMAEMIMRAAGEPSLFMIRDGEDALDTLLKERGYKLVDITNIYACPVSNLTDMPIPKVTAFVIWEPLAIIDEIWEAAGIGRARRAVMARAKTKTAILSRWKDHPAGVAFAAIHEGVCMVHAVEVLPQQRRKGVAGWMMRKAAFWAEEQGAHTLAVLCTQANSSANALYASLGFNVVGQYHYRISEDQHG